MSLTPRQTEVCTLFAQGRTMAEIGSTVGIAPMTARYHLHSAYARLGIRADVSRKAARKALAAALGVAYVEPPGPVRDESKRRAVPTVRWPRTWMEV